MRFPKQKIDVDAYLQHITNLLSDPNCNVFIDTNIISQLYRLNDEARQDVYRWIENYKDRFHVPVWSIHEYSRRIYSDTVQDYISELGKIKTYSNELKNISDFIKAYVGDTMLTGTYYANKKDTLFDDLDKINTLLERVSGAIKNKLAEHKSSVHQEIIDTLEPRALKNDIYAIIKEAEAVLATRYDAEIPPGFEDKKKERNAKGDLVIWMEILDYCRGNGVKKAILLSRDGKSDTVYEPVIQNKGGRKTSESERIRLAHESLVYEFKLATDSDDFYIVDFDMLVKILASTYRNLAKSFQISAAKEQEELMKNQGREGCAISQEDEGKMSVAQNQEEAIENQEKEGYVVFQEKEGENLDERHTVSEPKIDTYGSPQKEISSYSGVAIIDAQYDTVGGNAIFDEYIKKLKTHNWYVQNPALNQLMKIREINDSSTQENIDSTFVLGRNIIQSAEGSSGSAITFMENMASYIRLWPEKFKRAMIDGMLFEIFFNAQGELRRPPFKSQYMNDLIENIKKICLDNPFVFINERLKKQSKGRFAPILGDGKKYSFVFSFDEEENVTKLECNGGDITDTYPIADVPTMFSKKSILKNTLSSYYGISEDNIEIADIPQNIVDIKTRLEEHEYLPF